MTNRSFRWKTDGSDAGGSPFLLKPAGKDYLWGGRRLNDDFAKGIEMEPLAETWECSVHPDGPSVVNSGEFKGKTLAELLELHPEFLGTSLQSSGRLPILIKLIDAKEDLSVQVHPDDDYAGEHENGAMGKSEMWYVLDAAAGADIVYGFRSRMSREMLLESLRNGTVEKYLQRIPVHRDDVFFVPAGKVHAIGAGALIAEIQENSNLTYRMYDYDRVDRNGRRRPLHIEKAAEVAELEGSESPRQPMRVLKFRRGCALELLCRCKYFQVERMLLNTERLHEMADFSAAANSFRALLCTGGCGTIFAENGEVLRFFRGDCIFVPASSVMKIHGRATLLIVSC